MVQPVIAYTNINAGGGVRTDSKVTAALDIRSSYGAYVHAVAFHASQVSAGLEIHAMKSTDAGNSYDSEYEARLLNVFDAVGNEESAAHAVSFWVDRGYWLFMAKDGGPNTNSIAFTTAEVVTAYE